MAHWQFFRFTWIFRLQQSFRFILRLGSRWELKLFFKRSSQWFFRLHKSFEQAWRVSKCLKHWQYLQFQIESWKRLLRRFPKPIQSWFVFYEVLPWGFWWVHEGEVQLCGIFMNWNRKHFRLWRREVACFQCSYWSQPPLMTIQDESCGWRLVMFQWHDDVKDYRTWFPWCKWLYDDVRFIINYR